MGFLNFLLGTTKREKAETLLNEKDGSRLMYIPAGSFEMGDGSDSNCPKHRVKLSAYWIGVHAVTNAQYLKFLEATGHRTPSHRCHEASLADHPVVCVAWNDAMAYARWAGCELPTEAQWEKACRGPQGFIYAWGNEWDETKCRHLGNRQGQEETCAVYAYPNGVSGYGTYNQTGNVWEACADWYGENYYVHSSKVDPRGPESGSFRVFRGGSWKARGPDNFLAAYRLRFAPDDNFDYLGLRLVRNAPG